MIPEVVGENEKILRGVYHPMNFHKGKKELNLNLFRSPVDKDEVSVIRYDYIDIDELRLFLNNNSNSAKNRTYCGFCILVALEIIKCGGSIIPDFVPIEQHANILHGHVLRAGEEVPTSLKIKWEHLLQIVNDNSRYFDDPNPNSQRWEGREITL